jgi:hypothetical protein
MTGALTNVSTSTASLVISPASADAIATSGFDGPVTELPAKLLLDNTALYRRDFTFKALGNDLRDAKQAVLDGKVPSLRQKLLLQNGTRSLVATCPTGL